MLFLHSVSSTCTESFCFETITSFICTSKCLQFSRLFLFRTLHRQLNQFHRHNLRSFKRNRQKGWMYNSIGTKWMHYNFLLLQFDNPNSYLHIIKLHYTIYTLSSIYPNGVLIRCAMLSTIIIHSLNQSI